MMRASKLPTSRHTFDVTDGPSELSPTSEKLLSVADDVEAADVGLPFEPITLIFRDIRYFVPMPAAAKKGLSPEQRKGQLELLKGISGFVAPGVLTALMGGSGAGKVAPSPLSLLPLPALSLPYPYLL